MELTCLLAAARRWLAAFLRQPAEMSEQMGIGLILEDLTWRTKE